MSRARPTRELYEPGGEELEQKYVHDVYEQVADHFDMTRYKPWPVVEHFLQSIPRGFIGTDLGCGNGKYLGVNKDIHMIGCDRCERLLGHARQKAPRSDLFSGDHISIPMRSASMDFCISIAVLHHFSTEERRIQAARELLRILRSGGRFLIFVWAFEQQPDSRRAFTSQDALVSWSQDERVYDRYYHVFVRGELEALLYRAAEELSPPRVLQVEQSGYERDNWFVQGAII